VTIRKEEPCAKVEFQVKFRTEYGQIVKIVGSALQFGSWAIAKSPAMQWNEGDIWSATIKLPVNNIYEYKYVVVDSYGASVIHWQKGNNCILAVGLTDTDMVVGDNWEGSPGARVTSKGKGMSTKEERLLDWAEEVKSMSSDNTALVLEQKRKLERIQEENRLVRQEASRLKSELRMASMTRQATEQQVKELQQENRMMMSLLTEQQAVHKTVMQEALTMLDESEATTSDIEAPLIDIETSVDDTPEPAESNAASSVLENGAAPPPATKSRRPKRKSNRRQRRQRFSTRSAAVSPQG